MFNTFVLPFAHSGALAANLVLRWKVPFAFTVHHISVLASNASDSRFKLGTASDDDEFLTYTEIGDSNTAVEVGDADTDWRYDIKPALVVGDTLLLTLDFDGATGTAAEDLSLFITCTKD